VAYAPSAAGGSESESSDEPILGWYYWTWKTEWEIDTWSYRRGWRDGWIPTDVGNRSTFAFPVLEDGCVDSESGWEAPERVGAAVRGGGLQWWWCIAVLGASTMVGTGTV
jgi:glucan 1,3-beta-glucosidase